MGPLLKLQRPFNDFESEKIRALIDSVDEKISSLGSHVEKDRPLNLDYYNGLRLFASNSLKQAGQRQGDDQASAKINAWLSASQKISDLISLASPVTLKTIIEINQIITQQSHQIYRQTPLAGGNGDYLAFDLIPGAMDLFEIEVINQLGNVHPIIGASRLYQWLISIHPFDDGNGRTARLAADWALGLHGYLPLTYADPTSAFASVFDTKGRYDTFTAVQVIANGIENSVAALLWS